MGPSYYNNYLTFITRRESVENMSISASEIEKLEGGTQAKKRHPAKYTEEFRKEAVEFYNKAHEESGKTIKQVAKDLGINDKTLNDWVVKYNNTGRVSQARSEAEVELGKARRRIKELEEENEFLKKAAAFFARTQA